MCGPEEVEMSLDKLLSVFCNRNDIFVAMPKGVEANECVHLAKPILCDEKVMGMASEFCFHCCICSRFSMRSSDFSTCI